MTIPQWALDTLAAYLDHRLAGRYFTAERPPRRGWITAWSLSDPLLGIWWALDDEDATEVIIGSDWDQTELMTVAEMVEWGGDNGYAYWELIDGRATQIDPSAGVA